MLLFAIIGLIILILILLLHYTQHFQFHFKKCFQRAVVTNSSDTTSNIIQKQMQLIKRSSYAARCCCMLTGVDDFDFFPISFLLYLSFLTLLCLLIIIVQLLNYYYSKDNKTIIDLLFGNSLSSYHNNSPLEMHQVNVVYILDYILTYAMLIFSVWVSLFSFYRYYTTRMFTKNLQSVSTKKLFSKFAIYALIFCILFMIQIHLYYWIYPIVIILFCLFNFYCTFKFAAMLIKQYKLFIELKCMAIDSQEDILKSSILSKYISLICCILQSINLSLFVIMYNVNIIYYLPILWAISSVLSALNFARNRIFLRQNCKCINIYSTCTNVLSSKNNKEIITKDEIVEIAVENEQNISKEMMIMTNVNRNIINSQSHCDLYSGKKKTFPLMLHRSLSDPVHEKKSDSNTVYANAYDSYDNIINIAPKLLKQDKGSKSLVICNDTKSVKLPQISFLQAARSHPYPISSSNKLHNVYGKKIKKNSSINMTDTHCNNNNNAVPRISALRTLSVLSRLSSISLTNTGNESMYHNMDDDNNSTPEPQLASPIPTLHLNVTPIDNNDTCETNVEFEAEEEEGEEELEDDDAGFSILSGYSEDIDEGFDDEKNEMVFGLDRNLDLNISIGMPIANELNLINHAGSQSVPTNMHMDEIFESCNILAKCGFYSPKNVNELNKYQKRFSKIAKFATPQ